MGLLRGRRSSSLLAGLVLLSSFVAEPALAEDVEDDATEAAAELYLAPPSLVERWFFLLSAGYGHQPSTELDLFAWTFEFGLRPFFGALTTSLSLSGESAGGRFNTLGGGLALGWDLVYIVATGGFARPPKRVPFSLVVGARLGLVWGVSHRPIPTGGDAPIDYRFALLRPELRLFADARVPLIREGTRAWGVVLRFVAYDMAIPTSGDWDISRFTITLGVTLGLGYEDEPPS